MKGQVDVLDKAVAKTGYFAGNSFTLADINILPMLFYAKPASRKAKRCSARRKPLRLRGAPLRAPSFYGLPAPASAEELDVSRFFAPRGPCAREHSPCSRASAVRRRKPGRTGRCASSSACRPRLGRHLCADRLAIALGQLGQPFVIENRPGASGNIGTEAVVRSAPDGYTLLAVGVTNATGAALYDNLKFDFLRDIVPIASTVRGVGVLVVNPALPATASRPSSRTRKPIPARSTSPRPAPKRAAPLRATVHADDRGLDGARAVSQSRRE